MSLLTKIKLGAYALIIAVLVFLSKRNRKLTATLDKVRQKADKATTIIKQQDSLNQDLKELQIKQNKREEKDNADMANGGRDQLDNDW